MNIVYVTCGTLGAGHLVRGIAVGRALERAASSASFHIISPVEPPSAMRPALQRFDFEVCKFETAAVLDPARAQDSALGKALVAAEPDLLLVDLFWAPLLHIRPLLTCPAWLLIRSCPPIWLVGNEQVPFDAAQYQRVIGIEDIQHPEIREHIEPMVVSNPEERRSREEFCDRFGADPSKEIVCFSHGGLSGEIDALKKVDAADNVEVIKCDLHKRDAEFPLGPWLAEVDRVHCSAGYNTYWEAKWLGFFPRTTFSVFRRKIDDPLWRVKHHLTREMKANGADTLVEMIEKG